VGARVSEMTRENEERRGRDAVGRFEKNEWVRSLPFVIRWFTSERWCITQRYQSRYVKHVCTKIFSMALRPAAPLFSPLPPPDPPTSAARQLSLRPPPPQSSSYSFFAFDNTRWLLSRKIVSLTAGTSAPSIWFVRVETVASTRMREPVSSWGRESPARSEKLKMVYQSVSFTGKPSASSWTLPEASRLGGLDTAKGYVKYTLPLEVSL